MFINRKEELDYLNSCYTSDKFEFVILYGRRRVGKSRLVLESIRNERSVYFLATETEELPTFSHLKETISYQTKDEKIMHIKDDWEAIIKHLIDIEVNVVVIDEFPYLISANKTIKSIFQRIIDLHLSKTSMTLILMGSSISIMEDEVLSTKSPLYGRRTGQIKLLPLKFRYLQEMFPDYSLDDLVRVYASVGGIPYYLLQFNPKVQFWDNIQHILNPRNILFEEVKIFLLQELRKISTYSAIIQHIATGSTKVGEIKSKMQIKSDITPYLNTLQRLEIIEKKVPVSENALKSRNGRYFLKDEYFVFWYMFISKYKEQIIMGADIIQKVKVEFPRYVGPIFEKIVKQLLEEAIFTNKLKFSFDIVKIDRWWYKDTEIDLIGINSDNILFVEIKWQDLSIIDIKRIYSALRDKTKKTQFQGKFYYLIIARSIEEYDPKGDEYLLDLKSLINLIDR